MFSAIISSVKGKVFNLSYDTSLFPKSVGKDRHLSKVIDAISFNTRLTSWGTQLCADDTASDDASSEPDVQPQMVKLK